MRLSFWLGAAASQICLVPAVAGTTPTTTTLMATPNPAVYGQIVTLTATVSSASATGSVTFYDGVTVLGTKPLSGGIATFFTILLPSGTRSLSTYYAGDANYAAGKSATVSETVNAVPGQFQAAVSITANYGGAVVVMGDFNGDGKADLALGGGVISILLGNGDGTFQPPVNYSVGSCFFPRTLALGDFNGDGKADLAISDECGIVGYCTGTSTSILLGNGDGTFKTGPSYTFTGTIAAGDFNGDGKADLVTGGGVLLGNGDGTFQKALSYGLLGAFVVGDFNGDGKADLAIANSNINNMSVLLGNGDGTFRAATTYSVGSNAQQQFIGTYNPQAIAIGDFNGDGKADLAVTNSNGASKLLGNGDGTFQPPVNYAIGSGGGSVTVGAFEEDGRADLAVTAPGNNTGLSVLLNTAPTPDLTIAKSHTGNFAQAQTGAVYTITVSNIGSASTSGTVTVTDTLPAGLT